MHENWLRTARGRPVLRPPATARIRTAGHGCPADGTAPAEPRWSRRANCVCGRLAGSTGPAPRDDQTRFRSGQEQNAGRQQADRKMVHARFTEKPLRAPERDDVRNDVRDTGNAIYCKRYIRIVLYARILFLGGEGGYISRLTSIFFRRAKPKFQLLKAKNRITYLHLCTLRICPLNIKINKQYIYSILYLTCFQEADEKLWHDEKVQLQIALMKAFDSKSLRSGYVEQVFQQVN